MRAGVPAAEAGQIFERASHPHPALEPPLPSRERARTRIEAEHDTFALSLAGEGSRRRRVGEGGGSPPLRRIRFSDVFRLAFALGGRQVVELLLRHGLLHRLRREPPRARASGARDHRGSVAATIPTPCWPGWRALRAPGARIVLDDFGTGYPSRPRLSLCCFPFDKLKIDRSFVRGPGTVIRAPWRRRRHIGLCRVLALSALRHGGGRGATEAAAPGRWRRSAATRCRATCSAARCRRKRCPSPGPPPVLLPAAE